jgi:hypothetical protein
LANPGRYSARAVIAAPIWAGVGSVVRLQEVLADQAHIDTE